MGTMKPPEQRQRRNKAATAATLSESGTLAPALPKGIRCEETRTYWEAIWATPMASQWTMASDVQILMRLAILVDQFWTTPTKELAADIAKHEARFGLTPLDRMRLQWKLEAAPEKPVRQSADPDEASVYGALSVVK